MGVAEGVDFLNEEAACLLIVVLLTYDEAAKLRKALVCFVHADVLVTVDIVVCEACHMQCETPREALADCRFVEHD